MSTFGRHGYCKDKASKETQQKCKRGCSECCLPLPSSSAALKKQWWMLLLPCTQQQQRHSQLSAHVHLAPSEVPEGGATPTPRPGADGGLPEALVVGLQMAAVGYVKHEAMHFARWAICGKLLPKGLKIVWGVSSRHLPQIAGSVVGLLRRSGVIPV